MPENLVDLAAAWLDAKNAEREATERRRSIEDRMLSYIGVPENLDGTLTNEADGGYTIKVVGRMNRKIDAEKLQEIAVEQGLMDHLSRLFRWKPELDMKAWKAADEGITRPLTAAITTVPTRPSFTVTWKD